MILFIIPIRNDGFKEVICLNLEDKIKTRGEKNENTVGQIPAELNCYSLSQSLKQLMIRLIYLAAFFPFTFKLRKSVGLFTASVIL